MSQLARCELFAPPWLARTELQDSERDNTSSLKSYKERPTGALMHIRSKEL